MYVRSASGPFQCWPLYFNNEHRENVVHRFKLLLSYVVKDSTFNEVYNFTDEQILVVSYCKSLYNLRDYTLRK